MAEQQSFGERLKALREATGLSPYQLAKKAGISGQAVTLLERGERQPSWDTVLKLARALGVSVGDFDPEREPDEPAEEEPEEDTPPEPPPAKKKPKK